MKQKRRTIIVFSVLLCFSMFSGIASADQVEITINDASGSYETSVDVSVVISNVDDVGSIDLVVTYDPTILQVESVSKGEINNGMISSNSDTAGIISIAIADQNGIDEEGEIAVISFTVLEETGSSPLRIEDLIVYDTDSIEISATARDGTFMVSKISSYPKAESPGFELMVLIMGIICIAIIYRGRKQ